MAGDAKAEPVYTRRLNRAVQAHGEMIDEISFREPIAKDIVRYGLPVNFPIMIDPDAQVTFDEPKMTAMMAQLAAVPVSAIEAMTPGDWTSCAWGLAPFFVVTKQREDSA